MDKHILQVILENSILEEGTSDSVRSYSGRGMYGKECLAIDTDGKLCHVLAQITRYACQMARKMGGRGLLDEDLESVCNAIERASSDSLGMGTIVYFPGVPYVGTLEADEG